MTGPDAANTEPDAVAWHSRYVDHGDCGEYRLVLVLVAMVGDDGVTVARQTRPRTVKPRRLSASNDRRDDRTESTSEADPERG